MIFLEIVYAINSVNRKRHVMKIQKHFFVLNSILTSLKLQTIVTFTSTIFDALEIYLLLSQLFF